MTRLVRWVQGAVLTVGVTVAVGCGGAATTGSGPAVPDGEGGTTVAPPTPPPVGEGDPWAIDGLVREEWLPLLDPAADKYVTVDLPGLPKGVPPAPASCNAYVSAQGTAPDACTDRQSALTALDAALSADNVDAALAGLESCAGIPPGVVRALRIEMAPGECGDVLAAPVLNNPPKGLGGPVYHALVGQALAARLERSVSNPPTLKPPYKKDRVQKFIQGPMLAWVKSQAEAIQAVSKAGVKLPYYGKGIVAISAGLAELRLVQAVRDAPIPDEFKGDDELESVYYGSLDIALEPRKHRGRDAALVGLKELAHVGVLGDKRVDAARKLLAGLYGGRRIDGLDPLMLGAFEVPAASNQTERLAQRLPAFYAGLLIDEKDAVKGPVLEQLVANGLGLPHRIALKDATLDERGQRALVRARLRLGQTYWRAVDFDLAALVASKISKRDALVDLWFATALALRDGPDDAATMMVSAPGGTTGIGNTKALDFMTQQGGEYAGHAAFNAAVIKQIATPPGAARTYWEQLANRYRVAAERLPAGPQRDAAKERADAAQATADQLK